HNTVAAASDQHRVLAHIGRQEIAGLGHLAVVAKKQPAAREDALQFLSINLRLDKDAPTDQTALIVDQTRDVFRHPGLLTRPPLWRLRIRASYPRPSIAPSGDKSGGGCSRCSGGHSPRRRTPRQ